MTCQYCGKKLMAEGVDFCSSRCLQSSLRWGVPHQKPKRSRAVSRILEDPFVDTPGEMTVREKSRVYALRRYGLTPSDYEALYEKQNGVCALCGERRAQAIDHCHETGRVRGLLCFGCNSALGILGDNLASIQRVIRYLESDEVFTSLPPKRR